MRIAIVGTFQTGKSTLMNCLIKDCLANVGIGIPTTHMLNYYTGAKNGEGRVLFKNYNGEKVLRTVTLSDYRHDSLIPYGAGRVDHELPNIPWLVNNTFIDTPGLNSVGKEAMNDNSLTTDIINRVDSVLLVLPNTQIADAIRDSVFPLLRKAGVPVVSVMNCLPKALNVNDADPNSEKNLRTASQIERELCNNGIEPCYIDDDKSIRVLPCNVAWAWLSFEKSLAGKLSDAQTTDVFNLRKMELNNLFSIYGKSVPTGEELAERSNFTKLLDGIEGMRIFKAKSVKKAVRDRLQNSDFDVLKDLFNEWNQ